MLHSHAQILYAVWHYVLCVLWKRTSEPKLQVCFFTWPLSESVPPTLTNQRHGAQYFLRSCSSSANQEIRDILWKSKDHYPLQNSPPLAPILRQTDSVHSLSMCSCKIYFNIILRCMSRTSKWSLFSRIPQKALYVSLYTAIRGTCPTHLILYDLFTVTIFAEEWKSWSFSSCSCL